MNDETRRPKWWYQTDVRDLWQMFCTAVSLVFALIAFAEMFGPNVLRAVCWGLAALWWRPIPRRTRC